MVPRDTLKSYFNNYPEIIRNTEKLADQCDFSFNFKVPKNKRCFTGSPYEDRMLLEGLEGYRQYANEVAYRLVPGVW